MGTCASKEVDPPSPDPYHAPLASSPSPLLRGPSLAAGLVSGAASATEQTRKTVSSTLAQRYIHNGLEASSVLFEELAHHVPLFGPVCKVLAVVCTLALNANSQPEYARRHAIKLCAYRDFLEPLQDTHAGEEGQKKASKVLRAAIDSFASVLHDFSNALHKLSTAKNLDRVRASFTSDPLKNEWTALEHASLQLQRALGLETCANIKLLLNGQRDVQMKLAMISANLVEFKGAKLDTVVSHDEEGQEGVGSPLASPTLLAPSNEVKVEMVSIEFGLGSGSPASPISPVSSSAVAVHPRHDVVMALGQEGQPGGDDDQAAVSVGIDPFLEALVASYEQTHQADAAEKTKLRAERDHARGEVAEAMSRLQEMEKEVARLRESDQASAGRIAALATPAAEMSNRIRVLEEQLAAKELLLAAGEKQQQVVQLRQDECAEVSARLEQQQQELHKALETLAAHEKTIAALKLDLAKRDAAAASAETESDVTAAIRKLVPPRSLLPPVAQPISFISAGEESSPSSSSPSPVADPTCFVHGKVAIKVCTSCNMGLCKSCILSHPADPANHPISDFEPVARQLRAVREKEDVSTTESINKSIAACEERAQAWHGQAETAQQQSNVVQQRIDQEAIDYLVSEVARINQLLDTFTSTLQHKAGGYIERGLLRETKQVNLRAEFVDAQAALQRTMMSSDAVLACKLPMQLKELDGMHQAAEQEHMDLLTLPLDRFTTGVMSIESVPQAVAAVAEVLEVVTQESTGQYIGLLGIGKEGSGVGEFSSPYGVAVSGGLLYVADASNHRVQVFDVATRAHKYTIGAGKKGNGADEFNDPRGVTVTGGLLYVADTSNNRVQVFDVATRAHKYTIGAGKFKTPVGMAVSGGLLYVADTSNPCVQVFDVATRAHKYTINAGKFERPLGVVVSGGLLYVADFGDPRLEVFDVATRAHKYTIDAGKIGCCRGGFDGLRGMAVSGGLLYVANHIHHCVEVFDVATHAHRYTIGAGEAGIGAGHPNTVVSVGVAVSGGLLYVADASNHRVQILRA